MEWRLIDVLLFKLMSPIWMARLLMPDSWTGEWKLRRYCWRLMKLSTPQKTGFRSLSSSWMVQRYKLSHVPVTSLRLLGCWGFGSTPGLAGSRVAQVCMKLSRVVQLFRKLAPAIFADHLMKIYHALFHRHVEYRVILWGDASACTDILLIHKRTLRVLALAK